MRVVIAYPTLVEDDAVGNDVIGQYKCLKEEGIEAYIYAENYDSSISNLISKDSIRFLKDKDTILIYHHSIFWENGIGLLKNANCRKVIKYHNITPEHFFLSYSFDFFKTCLLGRRQNRELVDINIDMIISDSTFNSKDFTDIGFPEDKSRVLAPFHKIHEFESIKADIKTLDKLSNGKINVFFVGRMAPNKGYKNIIYTAYYYKLLFGNNIRFAITGGLDPRLNGYYAELTILVNHLGIGDIVEFFGRVSVQELKSYYLGSHFFLLLTEHEGFCMPILESQYFRLPLVAYGFSGIKETIGENQIVYDDLDYEILASSIYTLYNDAESRRYLTNEGYNNFLKYERNKLKSKFILYLKQLG